MDEKSLKKKQPLAAIYFIIFIIHIAGGIITKRVYGHPEFMMLWHLPAAVFLILAGKNSTAKNRLKYYKKRFS